MYLFQGWWFQAKSSVYPCGTTNLNGIRDTNVNQKIFDKKKIAHWGLKGVGEL